MKRFSAILLLCLAWAAPAAAQTIDTGTITATASSCSAANAIVFTLPNPTASLTIQLSGTFSATTAFYGSADGTNFNAISMVNLADQSTATGATAVGSFSIVNSGLQKVCVLASAYTSGTVTVTAVRGYGLTVRFTPFIPTGSCLILGGDTYVGRASAGVITVGPTSCGNATGGVNANTFTSSFGQALSFTAADVTTLARSTNNQRFVLGLASALYPALNRSTTGITMTLGDGTAGGFFTAPTLNATTSVVVGSTTIASTTLTAGGDVIATTGVQWGNASPRFYMASGTADGLVRMRKQAANTGVTIDTRVDGTFSVLSIAEADTAIVSARTFATSGVSGCTGAPTASTRGINTTCAEPDAYVHNFLLPMMEKSGYTVLRTADLDALMGRLAALENRLQIIK